MRALVLVGSLVVALLATPARSCELLSHFKVVGFDAAGTRVLVREETDATLALHVIELSTGKKKGTWSILEVDDDAGQRQKLRGQRWKEAEADLKKDGFTIKPDAFAGVKTLTLGELSLSLVELFDDEADTRPIGNALRVTKGKRHVDVASVTSRVPSDPASIEHLVLSPDRAYVVLTVAGCGALPLVRSVTDLEKRLAAVK